MFISLRGHARVSGGSSYNLGGTRRNPGSGNGRNSGAFRSSRIASFSLLAAGLWLSSLQAEDEQVFTQKPAVMPVRARGVPAAEAPAADKPDEALMRRGPSPSWIWGADANRRYFLRKEFRGGLTAARLRATCDNRMKIILNGEEVVRSDAWETPIELDVQRFLKPGDNVLIAEVVNTDGPAGFILKLALTSDKETRYVVSDETWQAAERRNAERWDAAKKIAGEDEGPWGGVLLSQASVTAVTASNTFQVLPGFQVERLFTVPKDQLGSWVCIAFDDKGRLLASDQEKKGLCRITPPPIPLSQPSPPQGRGQGEGETRVERLPVQITAAQGMLHAFGSLYLSVNGGPGSGLYRARDTDGDDQYDEVVKLKAFRGGGEHGPHALRLSPDGKSIFVQCGNHTQPPFDVQRNREPLRMGGAGKEPLRVSLPDWAASRLPANWDEDLLLPRQWDANGHAAGILAPGGWIARTDPEGKTWELFSTGYRNAYDMAFNADGELFTYDSDMEWDIGMPWYRPTRVTHATSGSEFGWRSGTGVWPAYYVDSLPPMIDIGPGSPVGVEFGYGTKFPAKYQKALYILDWTFGTIYALHLEPDGATYKATKEEFLSRTPLPLTDAAVGPDGALYFAIGGRGTQSELFRVTYVGNESTARVDARDPRGEELRKLRRQLEQYHQPSDNPAQVVGFAYPHLSHPDRFIRYAARVALEQQPVKVWQARVFEQVGKSDIDVDRLLSGAVALARQGDKFADGALEATLDQLPFASLTERQQLDLLRAYSLLFIRMGEPPAKPAAMLAKRLDEFYPAKSDDLNRELCQLLVFLKSPTVIAKTLALMKQETKPESAESMAELLARNRGYGTPIARMLANTPDLQKLHYAFALRNLREGWTPEQRLFYFGWLREARRRSGGASFQGFLNNIEKDAFENASDVERLAVEAAGLRKPFQVKKLPKPQGPGREWKLEELVQFAEPRLAQRDFKNGQKMYAAARCIVCHRFNGEGGATGPDLTQLAGRFTLKDLCEAMVEPSKVISDQYRASIVTTKSDLIHTGRIISDTPDALTILTDPEVSTKIVEIKKSDLETAKPSPVSLMPADLLKSLNEAEVLDLLAYLLSRGDAKHVMFRK